MKRPETSIVSERIGGSDIICIIMRAWSWPICPPEILRFFGDFLRNPAPEGMEQLFFAVARAGSFLESIRGLSGDILISTHVIAMKGLLEYLTPGSRGGYWSKYIGNCAIYRVVHRHGNFGIPAEMDP